MAKANTFENETWGYFNKSFTSVIGFITVLEATLTSKQKCEKLHCLYENLMSNNFPQTAVLKKLNSKLKLHSKGFYSMVMSCKFSSGACG